MASLPPRRRPPTPPRGTQPRQGMQAKGTVLGTHTYTPAPTARRWRTPTARSMGGQSGEAQRLTSDAPHNGGRHPPRGRPSATPTASNAGPQGRTLWGRCWVPTPAPTAPGTHGSRKPGCPLHTGRAARGGTAPDTRRHSQRWQATPPRVRPLATPAACSPHRTCTPRGQSWAPTPTHPRPHSRGRDSAWPQTPLTMVEGTPPGDALPPPPQRATPARKGARCGAGAGSPRSHRPHPGHTGCGSLAARSSGRAAAGGTAPDTRRPSQRWQATPPGTAPHHPRGTQPPQGMQARGTVLGPHTHTPAPTARGWQTPTARPIGGQSGEG